MDSNLLVNMQVPQPEQTLFKSAAGALNTAKAFQIDSADMRDLAARELTKVKGLQKDVDSQRKGITGPIDVAKKAVMDLFRAPTDFLDQAEIILKRAIGDYDRIESQRRIAEQAALEEAARKERARMEQEAAAAAAATRVEAERIQAEADAAAASGKTEDAARLAAEAQSRIAQGAAEVETMQLTSLLISTPVIEAVRQTKGVSTRLVWKAEVSDKLAFVRYVAAHPEYIDLIDANMPAVNKIALALKGNCPLDGVRVFEESVIAARAA
jgi:hypothetical protein